MWPYLQHTCNQLIVSSPMRRGSEISENCTVILLAKISGYMVYALMFYVFLRSLYYFKSINRQLLEATGTLNLIGTLI